MAAVKEIYQFLDQIAPFSLQMDFDNAGFLVGRGEAQVRRILVALDITAPVAEEAGRLAGWCALSPTSSRECYRGVAEVSIYLDRAFRGRGVGRMLLERLCAQSEKEGIWSLYAAVFAQNQASIRLFRGCGFRERTKLRENRGGRAAGSRQLR